MTASSRPPQPSASPQAPQINRLVLKRALDVSATRLIRLSNDLPEKYLSKNFLRKKVDETLNRVGVGFGIFSRKDVGSANDTNLFGAALLALAYSLAVCWGQFYILFWVFATWVSGSVIIFLLFKLLGSSHDLAEVMSSIGYAIAPLTFFEPLMTLTEAPLPGLSLIIKIIAVVWSSRTASFALIQPSTERKTFLFACPLILYNVFLLSLRTGA